MPERGPVRAKRAMQRALSSRWMTPAWTPLVRGRLTIFTMHRFDSPDLGVPGHDLAVLRRVLARLRRERYPLLSAAEAVRRLEARTVPERAVVFTVDDGYIDVAERAAGIFIEYDCPLTVFLTTGFVDGTHWQWWDQIAHVVANTDRPALEVPLDGRPVRLRLDRETSRQAVAAEVSLRCTRVPDDEKWRFIAELSRAAEVPIPARPPAAYAPLSWDDARSLETRGIDFGPHTVAHPVLIRSTAEGSAREIRTSWEVLRRRLTRPVPVFAYPNGDFGDREVDTVAELGLQAALTTIPEHASSRAFGSGRRGRYTVPRFPYPEQADLVCLTASGFSRISHGLRRAVGRCNR